MGNGYSLISLHSGAIEADIVGKEAFEVQMGFIALRRVRYV